MDEPWKIDYQVDRRDFWLDEYFTYFYHPWVRCLTVLLFGLIVWASIHKFLLTHNLATAASSLVPTDTIFWLVLVSELLRLWNRMPATNGVRNCSATIDAQRFCCVEPQKTYRFPWKNVMSIRQTVEYTLFFAWNGGTFSIPNRAFGTFEEAQRFFQTAQYYKYAARNGTPSAAEPEGVWPPAPRPGA